MENRAFALMTGLFILGVVAAVVAVGNWLSGEPLQQATYRVVSTIPVTGLNPQAQVRYRGVGVGRVKTIEIDRADPQRILVDVEIAAHVPVTRGTYAQLGQEGITGIAYVHLLDEGKDPGPAPRSSDGVVEIALRASVLDDMLDSVQAMAREAREFIAATRDLLSAENKKNVAATLASMSRVSADLEKTAQRLPATLARVDSRLEGWLGEDNRRLARDTLERVNEAARELPELARDARRLAEDSRRMVERVERLAGEAHDAAGAVRQETLPRVNALADSVERGAGRVGKLAYELERRPESLLWGRPAARPGPGEPGFE
ncbi:MAG: hypothetical protein A3G83_01240 [Betaproteobacteria bacterium RIFCSPLOWO2_12_FULL_68_20]|nr:MAG: hypothetical protein A3G83_01240 [Betaproteobacteria bacterium RIFCSPLOWO2_12_FULL_68_20]